MTSAADVLVKWKKSPLLFIRDVWKLTPQPLKEGIPDDQDASFYKPSHFEPFEWGKHLTWQQWLFFRAVERALRGEASRFISVTSGHGTAKSADMAILLLWFLFCFRDAQVPATAPTADQLYDVLWKEVAKWRNRMPEGIKEHYDLSTQYVRITASPETWFARARTARKEAPEALAGIHAEHVLILVDEASGVPEEIFETAQGALTNKNVLFIMVSNPTRLSGFFFNSHHKSKDQFQTLRFDSEESPVVDSAYVARMEHEYGRGSNQFNVRVKGLFPTAEDEQFIDGERFDGAVHRQIVSLSHEPRILGVDVARFGDDRSVLIERKGRNIRILKVLQGQDTMKVAGACMDAILEAQKTEPFDYVCVDVIGVGGGVVDRLKEQGVEVIGVNSSDRPRKPRFKNLRAELWSAYKDWLLEGHVPEELRSDTTGIHYWHDSSGNLQLESKDDMKSRGLSSPDLADAATVTFYPLSPIKVAERRKKPPRPSIIRRSGVR